MTFNISIGIMSTSIILLMLLIILLIIAILLIIIAITIITSIIIIIINQFHIINLRKILSIKWQDEVPDTGSHPTRAPRHLPHLDADPATKGRTCGTYVRVAAEEVLLWRAPERLVMSRRSKETLQKHC